MQGKELPITAVQLQTTYCTLYILYYDIYLKCSVIGTWCVYV